MHSGLCSLKQRKPNTIYSSIVFNEKNINNVKLLSSEGCIAFFTDWAQSRFYEKRVCSINTAELCCGFFSIKEQLLYVCYEQEQYILFLDSLNVIHFTLFGLLWSKSYCNMYIRIKANGTKFAMTFIFTLRIYFV